MRAGSLNKLAQVPLNLFILSGPQPLFKEPGSFLQGSLYETSITKCCRKLELELELRAAALTLYHVGLHNDTGDEEHEKSLTQCRVGTNGSPRSSPFQCKSDPQVRGAVIKSAFKVKPFFHCGFVHHQARKKNMESLLDLHAG